MRKAKYWGTAWFIGILIVAFMWWMISEIKDRKDPLNSSDAFVHYDDGILIWFELSHHRGKVDGQLHQMKIIEEIGQPPYMESKKYDLTGEKAKKGYKLKIKLGGNLETYDAWFSGGNLWLKRQKNKDRKYYKPVQKDELLNYKKAIQQDFQIALDQSEQKEKERINHFFSQLNMVYGYLSATNDGSTQLFLKVDEALREGELTCSLLMMEMTGDRNSPYKESKYVLNGITDGLMVRLYAEVDGEKVKLEGNFHGTALSFDLSFWKGNQKITFRSATEEEFKESHEKFKSLSGD
ncbi:MAG: hypothetical protein ACO1OC_02775 [Tuberibacillus sp.]